MSTLEIETDLKRTDVHMCLDILKWPKVMSCVLKGIKVERCSVLSDVYPLTQTQSSQVDIMFMIVYA